MIPEAGVCVEASVVAVIDGDTVRVSVTRTFDVRILDLWTPESRSKDAAEKRRGLKAKARLTELVAGRTVRVFIPAGDESKLLDVTTFGRVLGQVFSDGKCVAEVMRSEGLGAATKAEQVAKFGQGRYGRGRSDRCDT